MTTLINLESDENNFEEKINLDELYERKKAHDLAKLTLYNKILHTIHTKIKIVSRQKVDAQICWYVVPEFVLGAPRFDQASCISFLMEKLEKNKFCVKYIHPNLLLISWAHWVPTYIRQEFKRKTGLQMDEFGQPIQPIPTSNELSGRGPPPPTDIFAQDLQQQQHTFDSNSSSYNNTHANISQKKYKPISTYRPLGQF
jgi:hypothetical protein